MLIRFRVQNFLSFKEEVELSMIPGKARQHPSHIVSGGESRYDIHLLRAAVVYGANASGKSNLVKAIDFARSLIIQGTKARSNIPVRTFKLDNACASQPSRFEFEMRVRSRNYLYGFEVDSQQVHAEWLYEIRKTTETMLFERHNGRQEKSEVEFGNVKFENKKEADFLQFVAMGTRPNQLFLTECIERDVKRFEDVYNWFARSLVVVFPETKYMVRFDMQDADTQAIARYLEQFGTGVCGFEFEPVSPETGLPKGVFETISRELKPSVPIHLIDQHQRRYLISLNDQNEVRVSKLMLKHRAGDCQDDILMDAEDESDGTLRLMDLIPILQVPKEKTRVYVIDELDRSLHPNLCYQWIELFLAQPDSASQIVVTTHESNLLSFDLLRRDEIWFVEKDQQGASKVYSLEEFTPRYDKDIQKGYLLGRFGAIPIMGKKSF